MNALEYGLRHLIKRADDRPATQQHRRRLDGRHASLGLIARDLHALNFKHLSVSGLRQKHVRALVAHWQQRGHSPQTIRMRLADLRWWAHQVNGAAAVAKSNRAYGLDEASEVQKALWSDFEGKLATVTDPWSHMSLQLQAVFGLNTMESIKFTPSVADHGDYLSIKNTWRGRNTRRGRTVRCEAPHQRALIDNARVLAGEGALISPDRNYITKLRVYERHTGRSGFSQEIGARYVYALWRYEQLTGLPSPAVAGDATESSAAAVVCDHRQAVRHIECELGDLRVAQVRGILAGKRKTGEVERVA